MVVVVVVVVVAVRVLVVGDHFSTFEWRVVTSWCFCTQKLDRPQPRVRFFECVFLCTSGLKPE